MTWKGWIGIVINNVDAMKRIFSYILLLPLFAACMQMDHDEAGVENNLISTVSFQAEICSPAAPVQMNASTRTALGDKYGSYYPNYWAEGDAVSVNGICSAALTADSPFVATDRATFEVKGDLKAPYDFVYPASAVSSFDSDKAVVTLPEIQQWSASTYDASAFIMAGTSQNEILSFVPLMSAIKLTVPGAADNKIQSVTFMSLGTEKVSGSFTTDFAALTPTEEAFPFVHAVAPAGGADFGLPVYLLIPAQTYSDGIVFAIRATDGTRMVFSTKSSFPAQSGVVYPLTTGTYTPEPAVNPLMVMSSNVRYASARDKSSDPDTGERDWTNRKDAYCAMLNALQPAVVGLQEAEKEQVKDIKSGCSGYEHIGWGRESGKDITSDGFFGYGGAKEKEESTTILYRTDKISVQSSGKFWHSDTPDVTESKFDVFGDDPCRISTWAKMTWKENGKQFFYLNTHLSLYTSGQTKEIELILNKISELNTSDLPVVISGDWNLEEDDTPLKPIADLYVNARKSAYETDENNTYNGWGKKNSRPDHIFYSGFGECVEFSVVRQSWNGINYISDHYPIYATLKFDIISIPSPKIPVNGNADHEAYISSDIFE